MIDKVVEAVTAYCNGQEDRSGTGPIDILVAEWRAAAGVDRIAFAADLNNAIAKLDMNLPGAWAGIQLIIEKVGLVSDDITTTVAAHLSDVDSPLDARDRYYELEAFRCAGGRITPKRLDREKRLKSELPQLWFDLAIEAYRADRVGLADVTKSLVSGHKPAIGWRELRRRFSRLAGAFGPEHANWGFSEVASSFSSLADRRRFLDSVDERQGTQLSKGLRAEQPQLPSEERQIRDRTIKAFPPLVSEISKWHKAKYAPLAA